ncbi:hypothetical protein [Bordetella flabilis]|uniref:Uncharacterized protein n=1 Tax=Bordetella flabilis TaxID=463014 RepID=A0A193GMK4_9BORD|nr:hypothetical protein [Bordetella flabilis]ANN80833.1 hypothetical protein BAU07_26270 [Bordetella flabilis]
MADRTVQFQRAVDFLSERQARGPIAQRIGLPLHAGVSLPTGAHTAQANTLGLRALVRGVASATKQAFRARLAEFSEDSERISTEFFFAQSNRLSGAEQVALFMEGRESGAVAHAAARQPTVPRELQNALLEHGFHHTEAMRALAANPSTHPQTLLPLASHPIRDVRIAVASHIGPRMRIEEKALEADKQLVFNTLIEQYEDGYGPFIIPVCKDLEQLRWVFDRSTLTPATASLFTENPYASNDILLSVLGSNTIGLLPGGPGVKERARALVNNRLGDLGPTL